MFAPRSKDVAVGSHRRRSVSQAELSDRSERPFADQRLPSIRSWMGQLPTEDDNAKLVQLAPLRASSSSECIEEETSTPRRVDSKAQVSPTSNDDHAQTFVLGDVRSSPRTRTGVPASKWTRKIPHTPESRARPNHSNISYPHSSQDHYGSQLWQHNRPAPSSSVSYSPTTYTRQSPISSPHSSVLYRPGAWSSISSQTSVSPSISPATRPQLAAQLSTPPPPQYKLYIRQQPDAARACGFGDRDRRVIDPPPILSLQILDPSTGGPLLAPHPEIFPVVQCALFSADGHDDLTDLRSAQYGEKTVPETRLIGTAIESPYDARDEHGVPGTFFAFADLSCRSPGRFRLRFTLTSIDPCCLITRRGGNAGRRHFGPSASVMSDIFTVYPAKHFPGMRESSDLLKCLRAQGLNVRLKKGAEGRRWEERGKKRDKRMGSGGSRSLSLSTSSSSSSLSRGKGAGNSDEESDGR